MFSRHDTNFSQLFFTYELMRERMDPFQGQKKKLFRKFRRRSGLGWQRILVLLKLLPCMISVIVLVLLFLRLVIKSDKAISKDEQRTSSLANADTSGAISQDPRRIQFLATAGRHVLSRDMSSWYFNDAVCSGNINETDKYVLTYLRGPQHTPIYVYGEEEDLWVSGNLIKRGMWEIEWVIKIHKILAEDLETTFIDIGANVGVYTLTAAKLGCNVVAIDPFVENIERLCKSVEIGNLTRNIILVHNAVSNTRGKVALEVENGNIGATYVKNLNQTFEDKYVVDSILLDDLLEVFTPRKVVIKMDVETFEAKVLDGGRQFFSIADVICVLLEFGSHRNSKSGEFIISFLKEFQLEPDVPPNILRKYKKWPGEVLFIKPNSKGHSIVFGFNISNILVWSLIYFILFKF